MRTGIEVQVSATDRIALETIRSGFPAHHSGRGMAPAMTDDQLRRERVVSSSVAPPLLLKEENIGHRADRSFLDQATARLKSRDCQVPARSAPHW